MPKDSEGMPSIHKALHITCPHKTNSASTKFLWRHIQCTAHCTPDFQQSISASARTLKACPASSSTAHHTQLLQCIKLRKFSFCRYGSKSGNRPFCSLRHTYESSILNFFAQPSAHFWNVCDVDTRVYIRSPRKASSRSKGTQFNLEIMLTCVCVQALILDF